MYYRLGSYQVILSNNSCVEKQQYSNSISHFALRSHSVRSINIGKSDGDEQHWNHICKCVCVCACVSFGAVAVAGGCAVVMMVVNWYCRCCFDVMSSDNGCFLESHN